MCVFAPVEPCTTFACRFQQGHPVVNGAKRKCLPIYYYVMDRDFGLLQVMVQTGFPLRLQVLVNGHHWVANTLATSGIKFSPCDKVFVWLEDLARAQRFAARLTSVNWPKVLDRYARQVNPLLGSLRGRMPY